MSSERRYDPAACAGFRFSTGPLGYLSNFSRHPVVAITADGPVRCADSERLYQAMKFPHDAERQARIVNASCAKEAKALASPGALSGRERRDLLRSGWDERRVAVMDWVIRLKAATRPDEAAAAFAASGDRMIVEISVRDAFWGAQPRPDGSLVGVNALGRLLTRLRDELRDAGPGTMIAAPGPGLTLLGSPVIDAARGLVAEAAESSSPQPDLFGGDFP